MPDRSESEIREALGLPPQPYKSPFSEGLEAASRGVAWTRSPYHGPNQQYESSEWQRGHMAHFQYGEHSLKPQAASKFFD